MVATGEPLTAPCPIRPARESDPRPPAPISDVLSNSKRPVILKVFE